MIRGGGGYAVVLTAKNHYVLSLSKTFIGYIILIQPMKTRNRPDMTEKLLNRTLINIKNEHIIHIKIFIKTKILFFQNEKYFFKKRN